MPVAVNHYRRQYTGWDPSGDALNTPPDKLLRMDNLVLDDKGIPSLRPGRAHVYSLGAAIESIATAYLDGDAHRLAAAGSTLYADGAPLATGIAGSGPVSIATARGWALFARGSTRRAWDGSTLRTWGLGTPGAAPAVAAVAGTTVSIGTFTSAESPAWSDDRGTKSFNTGHDNTANGALYIETDQSKEGQITKTFASPQDYSGDPEDVFDFFFRAQAPQLIQSLTLMFDCDDGLFQNATYYYRFERKSARTVITESISADTEDLFDEAFELEGTARDRAAHARERTRAKPINSVLTPGGDTSSFTSGWSRLSIPRSAFLRLGNPTKSWDTVKAVRLAFTLGPNEQGSTSDVGTTYESGFGFDSLNLLKGKLTGDYVARYRYKATFDEHTAIGGVSEISEPISLKNGKLDVTVTAGASPADEIDIFIGGGTLDRFYRADTVNNANGTHTIDVADRELLIADEYLDEHDNDRPPAGIIDLAGPYYDRVFALTDDGHLHPSRRNNPDGFSPSQVIRVGGSDETPLWIRQSLNGLYVGTTQDIYRLSGTGDELPDGTISFRLDPLNHGSPPTSRACAQQGEALAYIAEDGPRLFSGASSQPLTGVLDRLWRGEARHGIPAFDRDGPFALAFAHGFLHMAAPDEDSPGDPGTTIYKFRGDVGWYRHTYSSRITCLFREREGTLLAGDQDGEVWEVDVAGTALDGDEEAINVHLLTPMDDNGEPLSRKDAFDFQVTLDTRTSQLQVQLYTDVNGFSTPDKTFASVGSPGMGTFRDTLEGMPAFVRVQLRLTGGCNRFKLWLWDIAYRRRPQIALLRDTGYVDVGRGELAWVREIRVKMCARSGFLVRTYFDGVLRQTTEVPFSEVLYDQVGHYRVPLPRGVKGRQARVEVISATTGSTSDPRRIRADEFERAADGAIALREQFRIATVGFDRGTQNVGHDADVFECYWIEFRMRPSGNVTQNPVHRVDLP